MLVGSESIDRHFQDRSGGMSQMKGGRDIVSRLVCQSRTLRALLERRDDLCIISRGGRCISEKDERTWFSTDNT